jgi:hypothetical protein
MSNVTTFVAVDAGHEDGSKIIVVKKPTGQLLKNCPIYRSALEELSNLQVSS